MPVPITAVEYWPGKPQPTFNEFNEGVGDPRTYVRNACKNLVNSEEATDWQSRCARNGPEMDLACDVVSFLATLDFQSFDKENSLQAGASQLLWIWEEIYSEKEILAWIESGANNFHPYVYTIDEQKKKGRIMLKAINMHVDGLLMRRKPSGNSGLAHR